MKNYHPHILGDNFFASLVFGLGGLPMIDKFLKMLSC